MSKVVIFGIIWVASIAFIASVESISNTQIEVEAVKSGLQQCLIKDKLKQKIVWQKQCQDNRAEISL